VGITLVAGNPYFIAASTSSAANVTNAIVLNLNTGKIQTGSTTSSTPNAGNGGVQILPNTAGQSFSMAACMVSGAFLRAPALRQWAANPWSFWYPHKFDLTMMLNAPSGGGGSGRVVLALPRRVFVRR
jgi:hypothetical protein